MVSPLKDAKLLAEAAERGRLKACAERDALAARVAELTKDRDDCLAARKHYAGLYGEALVRATELERDAAGLRAFANAMVDIAFEGGDADGGQIQELATKHGLLIETDRQFRCHEEFCNCAIYGFPVTCYVRSPALAPLAKPAKESE